MRGLVGAAERVDVRQVCGRILRDEGRLAMARGRRVARARVADRRRQGGEQRRDEDHGSEHCLSHRESPFRWVEFAGCSAASANRFVLSRQRTEGRSRTNQRRGLIRRTARRGRLGGRAERRATSPTCPTRRWSRSSPAATSRRSPSCTTGSAASPTGSRCASCATRRSPRTPCRRRSSACGARAGSFMPERAKARTWILTLVHRRAVDLVRREQRRRTEPLEESCRRPRPSRADDEAWLRLERERVQAALAAAARPAARGDRARLLRRVHAVGAGRAARPAAGHDQEPDVRRARAPARAPRRRSGRSMDGPPRADRRLRARRPRRRRHGALRGAPRDLRALPRGARRASGRSRARSRTPPTGRRRRPRSASGSSASARRAAERRAASAPLDGARCSRRRPPSPPSLRSRSVSGRPRSRAISTTRAASSRC